LENSRFEQDLLSPVYTKDRKKKENDLGSRAEVVGREMVI
jgi:hypothetical protein